MHREVNSLRGIIAVTLVAATLAIALVFLSKKEEIEIQRRNNSVSKYSDSISKISLQENVQNEEEATKEWELTSGNPDDICSVPVFKGKNKVRAWYIYGKGYANKKEWLLKIADGDISKLPLLEKNRTREDFHLRVRLEDASDELENKLRKSSPENPLEVEISAYLAYCDGISLASIQSAENI